MPTKKDLTGKRFGELTVLGDSGKRQKGQIMWLCQCDCGRQVEVAGTNLTSGNTKSCGHAGMSAIKAYQAKVKSETPGTRLDLLGDKVSKNSQLGYRNISIMHTKWGDRYRVAIVYKRKQYGGSRKTLAEAIELREELREKYWPDYVSDLKSKPAEQPKGEPKTPQRKARLSKGEMVEKFIEKIRGGKQYRVTIERNGKPRYIGRYNTLEKARLNRDRGLKGEPVDKSDVNHGKNYVEQCIKLAPSGRYEVQITRDGKMIHIGTYDTLDQARKNRDRARQGLPTEPTKRM